MEGRKNWIYLRKRPSVDIIQIRCLNLLTPLTKKGKSTADALNYFDYSYLGPFYFCPIKKNDFTRLTININPCGWNHPPVQPTVGEFNQIFLKFNLFCLLFNQNCCTFNLFPKFITHAITHIS